MAGIAPTTTIKHYPWSCRNTNIVGFVLARMQENILKLKSVTSLIRFDERKVVARVMVNLLIGKRQIQLKIIGVNIVIV